MTCRLCGLPIVEGESTATDPGAYWAWPAAPVHLYCADGSYKPISPNADRHELRLLENAARLYRQCAGQTNRGRCRNAAQRGYDHCGPHLTRSGHRR